LAAVIDERFVLTKANSVRELSKVLSGLRGVFIDALTQAFYHSGVKFGSLLSTTPLQTGEAICPGCGHTIPLEDINVAKDLALCRSCGKTWTFSLVNATKELKNISPDNPPRGVRVETDYEGATKITYKRASPIAFFFVIFTAIWGGGSMFGIYGSQLRKGHFSLSESLFGLPFLAGTIILCSLTAFFLFGRWEVKVRGRDGSVFVGVGPLGWRRQFTCGPDTRVSLEMSSFRVNNQQQEAIILQQGVEKIISFGAAISDRDVKLFIAAALGRAIV